MAHCFTREELLINEMEEAGTFIVLHLHPPLSPRSVGSRSGTAFLTGTQARSHEVALEQ